MSAWQELTGDAEISVWNRFERDFLFLPSVDAGKCRGIREPAPSETYSISQVYDGDESHYAKLNAELQRWGLNAFQELLPLESDWLNVLDWQHPCYRFYPHIPFELDEFDEWTIPILPNGDYYIFLEQEFTWGIFGHPWEQTMCIFGSPLLEILKKSRPELLTKLVRKNGKKA